LNRQIFLENSVVKFQFHLSDCNIFKYDWIDLIYEIWGNLHLTVGLLELVELVVFKHDHGRDDRNKVEKDRRTEIFVVFAATFVQRYESFEKE